MNLVQGLITISEEIGPEHLCDLLQATNLGQEDPPEKEMQPTPVFLPGESHGQRSLAGFSSWGLMESDTTE